MTIVYDGGKQKHLTEHELMDYLRTLDEYNSTAGNSPIEINDAAAQTIASYWHSPGSPNSTLLSTMGKVSDDMSLSDFASATEYQSASWEHRRALDYLCTYILDKQRRTWES